MKKSMIIGSALALTLGIATPALAAPTATFVDVPATSWSYDAVQYLAKAGIVDGYGDSTFKGEQTMTRSEMAQIVYKAMLNQDKANIAQKALIDKLASEYALEMNKIEGIDSRLAKVEKNQPSVKLSGRILEQYKIKQVSDAGKAAGKSGWSAGQLQVRLNASAKVDENTTVNLRIANPAPTAAKFKDSTANYFGDNADNSFKVDRFFATTKAGVAKISLGRQAMEIDPEDLIVDSGFFSYDGVRANWDWNGVNFDVKRGRFAKAVTGYAFDTKTATEFANVDIDSIMVSSNTGKLTWDAAWAKFSNPKVADHSLMNYYFGNVGYGFDNMFSVAAEYGKNQKASKDGSFWMLKGVYGAQSLNAAGKQNFTVQYTDAKANSINSAYTSLDQPDEGTANGHAFKNLDLAYRYAFSKNMTAKLQRGIVSDKTSDAESYSLWKAQVIYKF